jgi:hypothetical protein
MRKNKTMNSELNNHQTDWLAQTEELNDTEASNVNGGAISAAELEELYEISKKQMAREQGGTPVQSKNYFDQQHLTSLN